MRKFDRRNLSRLALWSGALLVLACQDVVAPTGSTAVVQPNGSGRPSRSIVIPGHYIVVFNNTTVTATSVASAIVSSYGGVLHQTYQNVIRGFAAELSAAAVDSIRRRSDVALVEPDEIVLSGTVQTNPTWGMDRIDQRGLPLSGTYAYTSTGNGVNVYIVDTGIRTTHTQFGGRASSVFDIIGDGNGGTDCNGHGTHVAGTVAGATYGLAKQARLFSVRVLDCSGSGTSSGVIAGLDWIAANHLSPAVINMSLGGLPSISLDQAVKSVIASGVTVAVAAGNDNTVACNESPARVPEAITVGASAIDDVRASFSNYGSCMDLYAPGVNIVSSSNAGDNAAATLSGTSMASPHAAGAAALYLQGNPAATPAQVAAALVANATTGVITDAGTGSPNRLLYVGNAPPVANFTSTCTGLTCTFNSSSSTDDAGVLSRGWAFSDGTTAGDVVSPTKAFSTGGTYSVTLTVTDAGGLSNARTQQVTVIPPNQPPVAAFTTACVALTCTFNSSTSTDDIGIVSRAWTFGDGSTAGNVTAPSKSFALGGTYTVSLTVTDAGGLSNTITQPVTVTPPNQPPVAVFTPTCVNLTCSFDSSGSSDDAGITNRAWSFGDGSTASNIVTASKSYSAGGTYTVSLTVTDAAGLTNTIAQPITVTPPNQPPVAAFTPSCVNLACTFDSGASTDDAGITNRGWSFGDGSTAGNVATATRTYAGGGTYTVSLTVTDVAGLSNTITQQVTVTPPNQAPVAAFTLSCTNLTCTFDSNASSDDAGITTRGWTFGDGTTAGNVVSPSKSYATGGTYSVTLTVTDAGGLTNTKTLTVIVVAPVNLPPTARFTASCPTLTCALDGRSSTDDNGVVSYDWVLSRPTGNTEKGASMSVIYPSAGPRQITLTVRDAAGLTNTITQTIFVGTQGNLPPVAAFTPTCTDLACTFDSSGSTDDFGITSRSWTFGDGSAAGNVVTPTKAFATAGTYTVTLTVTDAAGATNISTRQVTVSPPNQPPVAAFTASCVDLTCSFDSNGSSDDVGITSRGWAFGDGASAGNVVTSSRSYAVGGTYVITLTVTDAGGLTNTVTRQVTVTPPNQPPVAAFTPSCINLTCTFDSGASTDDAGITNRAWTFGDGSTAGNVAAASRTYAGGGTYTVSLTVTDGAGLSNTITRQVTVTPPNQPPVAAFTKSCINLTCTFDSSGSSDDAGITTRGWSFGDGSTAGSVVTASKTYLAAGTYAVVLTVTDAAGLTNTLTAQVTVTAPVDQPPVARFTYTCPALTCTLDASASSDDQGIVAYDWLVGKTPGPSATGKVVSVPYPHSGTRTVILTVTDAKGQTNSITQTIVVGNMPPVAAFTPSCTDLTCTFDSSGSTDDFGITSRSWAFGDGSAAGNLVTPIKTFATGGTYTVSLTVTDAAGATNTTTRQVTVTPPNQAPVAAFTASCVDLTCSFDSNGSSDDIGITSRTWAFGDGSSGNAVTSSRSYAAGGSYVVTLTVTDAGGLTNTVTRQVTVTPPNQPPVAAFTPSCVNLVCTFDSGASTDDAGITNRAWNFGDGSTAGNVATASKSYVGAGTYPVALTVTDAAGLTNTVTVQVTVTAPVDQPPVARFTYSCSALTCTLDASTSSDDQGIVSYDWLVGKTPGPSATGKVVPVTYPHSGTRIVTLTVTDAKGQTNTVTQNIIIP